MFFKLFLVLGFVSVSQGVDSNALFPRSICYPLNQDGCNQAFTDAYPEVSLSATNLTKADTIFWLFTRKNQENPENLQKCGGRLPPNTNYNPERRLIVVFHSMFIGYCDVAVFREWTVQMLEREDVNVLAVDYSWGNHFDVGTAELNLKIVAKQTVIVLKNIKDDKGLDNSRLYLIGLSLGGQVAGLVGGMMHVGRITALDPAGPGYNKDTPLEDRLDPSDADLVDVWHTNMGACLPNFGLNYDVGHVDYHINGGKFQPACYRYAFTSMLKMDYVFGCCQFVGVKCDSITSFMAGKCSSCGRRGRRCIIMGYDLDKYYVKPSSFPQRYYVKTSPDCPYCASKDLKLMGFNRTYYESLQNKTCGSQN